jgi:protein TonB
VKNKPYEQFGRYILFKKLESDALSELWRAAAIEGNALGPLVALRRFTGGNRDAIASSAAVAHSVAPLLTGTSFVRHQSVDLIDDVPFVAHEYAGGRSLRHIVDKARGGTGSQPNPIPMDQAIVIAEKVALSLATTADLRFGGNRLTHGGLLPQFVWITDDGEIRVAGQQLGPGLLASLKNARVAAEIGRYFTPESQATGVASKTADVWAMGAMLFLLVTGTEPPDITTASAFTQAVRSAKTTSGASIPDEIRAILDKSLTFDVNVRYASPGEMKQAISALANSGKYSATTFNLAFYVSTLLKKEIEGEALDRERESKVSLAPYIEALAAPVAPLAAVPEPPPVAAMPMFAAAAEAAQRKSKAPLAIAAVVVIAALGAGAFFMFRSQESKPKAPAASVQIAAVPPHPAIVSQPLVAAAPSTATAAVGPADPNAAAAAQKRAFEAAVQQKLQEEMMKLQVDYTNKLQQTQSKKAPVQLAAATSAPAAAVPAPRSAAAPEEAAPSASQLDQQRLNSRNEAASAAQTQSAAPAPTVAAAPVKVAPPPVREGDIVDVGSLDTPPHVTRPSSPVYPPMALRQRISTTVIVTALISETGEVNEVKILRGDDRFGFNDAALRAVRATRFSAGIKDGKHVKTWYPIPVQFKLLEQNN